MYEWSLVLLYSENLIKYSKHIVYSGTLETDDYIVSEFCHHTNRWVYAEFDEGIFLLSSVLSYEFFFKNKHIQTDGRHFKTYLHRNLLFCFCMFNRFPKFRNLPIGHSVHYMLFYVSILYSFTIHVAKHGQATYQTSCVGYKLGQKCKPCFVILKYLCTVRY